MLTADEIVEIEREARAFPDRRAVAIDALRTLQRRHGWVSDEVLLDLAAYLELPVADLEGVATFYNLIFRRPVGRHVILLCESVSCWMMGSERIRARIEECLGVTVGGTTRDGDYTLLPVACLGACHTAPCMMIDETTHRSVSEASVAALLGHDEAP